MNQKRVTDLSPDVKERIKQIVLEIGNDCDGAKMDYEKRGTCCVYGRWLCYCRNTTETHEEYNIIDRI
jgi:hypothetical protein